MAKGIPKFRYVEDTDDGCAVWQCLSCKAKWECRRFHHNFCGNCGVKWEGEHAWVEEYDAKYDYSRERAPEKQWYIEKKVVDEQTGDTFRDWTPCRSYPYSDDIIQRAGQARWIADELKRYRRGEELWSKLGFGSLRTTYRAVLGLREQPTAWDPVPDDYRLADLEEEVKEHAARSR